VGVAVVEEVGLTDVGRQRQSNEDSFVEAPPVFAVADGMGGARAGEVASRMAVEAFEDSRDPDADPEAELVSIARTANRRIYELAHSDDAYKGMGTTLTAVMVGGREVTVGHVGDSRLYRLRDDEFDRLTTDHSLVEELVRREKITPEEAETHPQKSIITRALGVEAEVEVDTLTCSARDGDVYLICSDGLTGMLSESEVADVLRSRDSLEGAARHLIDAANQAGGRDNITVVLFRVSESESDGAASDDGDTLSGQETETALHTSQVRTAVAEAEREGRSRPDAGADAGETMVIDARTAEAERASARAGGGSSRPRPRRSPATRRRVVAPVLGLIALAAVAAGLWVGARQAYFVGASDTGLVALYRGLPYELPFGLVLYEEVYESSLPASSIPEPQRREVLDHELRDRADGSDLVRELERGRTQSPAPASGRR
jgi:serine/threonine protein phosphatase PrpC